MHAGESAVGQAWYYLSRGEVGSLLLIVLGVAWVAGNLGLAAVVLLKPRRDASEQDPPEFGFAPPSVDDDPSSAPNLLMVLAPASPGAEPSEWPDPRSARPA